MTALAYQSVTRGDAEEDHLTPKDFQRVSALVGARVGIKLPPTKRMMVEGRLRKRMRDLGIDSFKAYCARLFDEEGQEREIPHLINAVTTNKTDFFREPEHYDYLESVAIPELIAARGEHMPLLKIWSAASSNGAEAYTAAMVLADMAANRGDFNFAVLGTDVSTKVLAQGRRAVYGAELLAPVPATKMARYVMHARNPNSRPEVRMAPELRRRVQFSYLNLMETTYQFDRDVDVIFLRNVLIYFDKQDQEAVIGRLTSHLRVGGYLMLGHSESMIGSDFPLRPVAPAIFQKI